jgi:hypothetical protein
MWFITALWMPTSSFVYIGFFLTCPLHLFRYQAVPRVDTNETSVSISGMFFLGSNANLLGFEKFRPFDLKMPFSSALSQGEVCRSSFIRDLFLFTRGSARLLLISFRKKLLQARHCWSAFRRSSIRCVLSLWLSWLGSHSGGLRGHVVRVLLILPKLV